VCVPPLTLASLAQLLKWLGDIARAMRYLHHVTYEDPFTNQQVVGIVHRDLKPDNCLVSETYDLKVADFGEARALDIDATMTMVGTPMYVAPEIMRGDHYDFKVDVYSFALTCLQFCLRGKFVLVDFLYEIFVNNTKSRRMAQGHQSRVLHNIQTQNWRPTEADLLKGHGDDWTKIPSSVVSLMILCWAPNSEDRPTFEEIYNHIEEVCKAEVLAVKRSESTADRKVSAKLGMDSGELSMRLQAAKDQADEDNELATVSKNELAKKNMQLQNELAIMKEEMRALKKEGGDL